jgi:hypothetical protein
MKDEVGYKVRGKTLNFTREPALLEFSTAGRLGRIGEYGQMREESKR